RKPQIHPKPAGKSNKTPRKASIFNVFQQTARAAQAGFSFALAADMGTAGCAGANRPNTSVCVPRSAIVLTASHERVSMKTQSHCVECCRFRASKTTGEFGRLVSGEKGGWSHENLSRNLRQHSSLVGCHLCRGGCPVQSDPVRDGRQRGVQSPTPQSNGDYRFWQHQ